MATANTFGDYSKLFGATLINSAPGNWGSGVAQRWFSDATRDDQPQTQGASTGEVRINSGNPGLGPQPATAPRNVAYTGSGGNGASTPAYDPVELGLIDNQIGTVNSGIGRIGDQRVIGMDNILNSYIEAQNALNDQRGRAQRDYQTNKDQTGQDFTNTRSNIRSQAGQQFTGLQRLLGSMGSGRSSAAQVLAPFAVGREAATRFGDVEQDFQRNQGYLDTANQDSEDQYSSYLKQIARDRDLKKNELNAGLAENEAGLQDQLAGLQLQKQQLLGGSLDNVLAAIQPYQSRVQSLLSQIDNYGRQYKNSVKATGEVKFARPDLDAYDYSQFSTPTLNGQRDPRSDYTSPLVSLLNQPDDEEKRLV